MLEIVNSSPTSVLQANSVIILDIIKNGLYDNNIKIREISAKSLSELNNRLQDQSLDELMKELISQLVNETNKEKTIIALKNVIYQIPTIIDQLLQIFLIDPITIENITVLSDIVYGASSSLYSSILKIYKPLLAKLVGKQGSSEITKLVKTTLRKRKI